MPIVETVRSEMTAAMRSGDTRRRDIMRQLLNALTNAAIEARREIDDDEALRVLQREAKQRRDSIEEYRKGSREDLARAEQEELDVISSYLPAPFSDEEIAELARAVIEEAGAGGPAEVGKVMGPLMQRVAGRADGRRVNEIVRELLASG